jgi:hypothetical protein
MDPKLVTLDVDDQDESALVDVTRGSEVLRPRAVLIHADEPYRRCGPASRMLQISRWSWAHDHLATTNRKHRTFVIMHLPEPVPRFPMITTAGPRGVLVERLPLVAIGIEHDRGASIGEGPDEPSVHRQRLLRSSWRPS